jgi:hypothetical protein
MAASKPTPASAPVETVETVTSAVQVSLLRSIRDAVDPESGYGMDVTTANALADVHHKLFGGTK